MRRLVIVGNGCYAQRMKCYLDASLCDSVCAFAVDLQFRESMFLNGIEVLAFDEMRQKYSGDDIRLIMGIGYNEMGKGRRQIFEQCKEWGYSFDNYIHPSAIIAPDVVLGEGNNILEGVIVEPGVVIGNANLVFGGSQIGHGSVISNYNTLASKVLLSSENNVGDHCYLGDCAVVSPGVVLGDYVFLGTMTCAMKDMPSESVLVPEKNKMIENKSRAYFNLFMK